MRRPEVTARPKPPSRSRPPTSSARPQRTSGPDGVALAARAIEQLSSGETRGSTGVRTATSGDRTRDVCFVR